jgi:hypothetical protein
VRGFHDACHLLLAIRSSDVLQEAGQLVHSFWRVRDVQRGQLASRFINDDYIVVIIGPVDPCLPPSNVLSDN